MQSIHGVHAGLQKRRSLSILLCKGTTEIDMQQDRLVEIESRIAHQEYLLSELNDALASQQAQIIRLQSLCETLMERVSSLGELASEGDSSNERPPHY